MTGSTHRYLRLFGSLASMKAIRPMWSVVVVPFCPHPDRMTLLVPHTPSLSASPEKVTDCGSQSCVTASPVSQQYADSAVGFTGRAAVSVP